MNKSQSKTDKTDELFISMIQNKEGEQNCTGLSANTTEYSCGRKPNFLFQNIIKNYCMLISEIF